MKKCLMLSTVASTISVFNMNNIKILQDMDYEAYAIANFENNSNVTDDIIESYKNEFEKNNVKWKHVALPRSIFDVKNIVKSYINIKNDIEMNKYELIHCHSPIGSVIARFAARRSRKKYGTKVIYTAHGFHFFKGAPFINWMVFFPLEWLCSFFTDVLITINKEDYSFAKKHMRAKKIEYIPGVGIDTEKIESIAVNREEKRKELGIDGNRFVVLSVGELNDNKNHETIIKAIAKLDRSDISYIICGRGEKEEYLKNLARELGVDLRLLGFRNDITEICKCSDIFAFPSKREGLGLAALEAMASGLPVVGSHIHGIADYLFDDRTGFGCRPTDADVFSKNILNLIENENLRKNIGRNNIEEVLKFDIKNVSQLMKKIYDI